MAKQRSAGAAISIERLPSRSAIGTRSSGCAGWCAISACRCDADRIAPPTERLVDLGRRTPSSSRALCRMPHTAVSYERTVDCDRSSRGPRPERAPRRSSSMPRRQWRSSPSAARQEADMSSHIKVAHAPPLAPISGQARPTDLSPWVRAGRDAPALRPLWSTKRWRSQRQTATPFAPAP